MEASAAKRAAPVAAEPRAAKRSCFFGAVVPEQLTLADCLAQLAEEPPHELVCPITHDLFKEPVVAADSMTYESTAILNWLAKRATSPVTNVAMKDRIVRPSHTVKVLVSKWVERQMEVASAAMCKARAAADSKNGRQTLNRVWALLERADAKRVVGLLEEAFWVRLPDAAFAKRMDHFRKAAALAGLPARQACVEAYKLAAGHQSFACGAKPIDLQEPPEPLSFLLPAVQHMRVYRFRFPAASAASKEGTESKLFHIPGIGTCRVRLASSGLRLLVPKPCTADEVRPVICSFTTASSSDAMCVWFQFCPAAASEEAFRGCSVRDEKLTASLSVELAVRALKGCEEKIARASKSKWRWTGRQKPRTEKKEETKEVAEKPVEVAEKPAEDGAGRSLP